MPSPSTFELPLFPLQTVLFPDGLLSLKVFEARYLDLVGSCLREGTPFGVVSLKQGSDLRQAGEAVTFESTGTVAELMDVDSAHAGILQVRCRGLRRFDVKSSRQQSDGLWVAKAGEVPDDEMVAPAESMHDTVRGLANAIATLKAQGAEPFLQPYRFDSAGWVANRWCEILPLPVDAKQRLLGLEPLSRLDIIDSLMRVRHTPS